MNLRRSRRRPAHVDHCANRPLTVLIGFAVSLLFVTQSTADASETAGAGRPNFVIFLADDLGWADVPWHGSPAAMPHLQRLADEGVRLESHYVHPMCSPTRTALLTGRYASRFGVTTAQNERALPFGTPTLASLLRSAGYTTALVGKWHLGSKTEWGPQHFGFDHSYGSLAGGCGPYDHRYKSGPFSRTWQRDGQLLDETGHVTDLVARDAVQWLEQRGGEPFFLYVAFTAIHVPIAEPDSWKDANAGIADPGKRLRAACATHMDHAIGQIVDTLERKGLRERTLVLFLSDNGAHAPSPNQGGPYPGSYGSLSVGNDNRPLRGHKGSVQEGGIRTPGIAHWPGRLTPRACHAPLHVVDWLPTVAALAGVALGDDLKLDGSDIWPALAQSDNAIPIRTLYCAGRNFDSSMVRHANWKLLIRKSVEGQPEAVELFDLDQDLGESHNLADEFPDVVTEMKRRLDEISSRDLDSVVRD